MRRFSGGSPRYANFATNLYGLSTLKKTTVEIEIMARDKRERPRGLVAPLSQAQLASLRGLEDGTLASIPPDHRLRLLHLELVEDAPDGLSITELGRQRLISDR